MTIKESFEAYGFDVLSLGDKVGECYRKRIDPWKEIRISEGPGNLPCRLNAKLFVGVYVPDECFEDSPLQARSEELSLQTHNDNERLIRGVSEALKRAEALELLFTKKTVDERSSLV